MVKQMEKKMDNEMKANRGTGFTGVIWVVLKIVGPLWLQIALGHLEYLGVPQWDPNIRNYSHTKDPSIRNSIHALDLLFPLRIFGPEKMKHAVHK